MAKRRNNNNIFDLASLGTPLASSVLKNLPFVIFLGFLGTLYISNIQYAENTMREIKHLEKEISDLRWQYMAEKADLMYNSKQSEVLQRVKGYGLSDSGKKPKKIVVRNDWNLE